MLLRDKVVIVSGVGPGLGSALAAQAAAEGAHVALAARTPHRLDEVEAEIRASAPRAGVLKVPADITRPESCISLVAAVIERFGRVDGLLNNAFHAGSPGPPDEGRLDEWRDALEVNLFGSLNMCRAVFPPMKSQGCGSIVNINTMAVRRPVPGQGGYAAAKAALAQATVQLALEWGRHGIRINSVFMGWMWGPAVIEYLRASAGHGEVDVDAKRAEIAATLPLGRMPSDRECARPVLTLLSDHMDVVTGASLDINAGAYMPG